MTLLMAGAAAAVALIPRRSAWLIFDRPAILSGQVWRMLTGHWVHFSTRHLVYDLIPLCVAGWIIEARGVPRFGWFCGLAPWVISAALLVFEPQMRFYGGLSAMGVALVVLLALDGLGDPPPWRRVCVAALLGVAGKIVFELAAGRGLFDTIDNLPVVISAVAHPAGVATAVIFYGVNRSLIGAARKRGQNPR
jgi:rhomboid family GlyGly-CTERM serine protease